MTAAARAVRGAPGAGGGDPAWRDWGGVRGGPGLPPAVLALVAEKVAAQTDEAWWSRLRGLSRETRDVKAAAPGHEDVQVRIMYMRHGAAAMQADAGTRPLFAFAMVCRAWRAAQLQVGGRLRTRVWADVLAPGRAALLAWALAEGCPARGPRRSFCQFRPPGVAARAVDLFGAAAHLGDLGLLRWLRRERGGAPGHDAWGACLGGDSAWFLMVLAARRGDLALARWVCAERGSVADWAGKPVGPRALFGGADEPAGDAPPLHAYAAAHGHLELVRFLCAAPGTGGGDPAWRDWGGVRGGPGLPPAVLALVAEKVAAQTDEAWWSRHRGLMRETRDVEAADPPGHEDVQDHITYMRHTAAAMQADAGTRPLFAFAMVCRAWRAAQLQVGGRLRTRVWADVLAPGGAALLAWALAEGCPARGPRRSFCQFRPPGVAARAVDLFGAAAHLGDLGLLRWLRRERGGAPGHDAWGACLGGDSAWFLMVLAARRGDLALVRWVCAERGSVADWAGKPVGPRALFGGADEPAGDAPPLHAYAAAHGHLELVRFLCAAHADAFGRGHVKPTLRAWELAGDCVAVVDPETGTQAWCRLRGDAYYLP